MNILRSILLTNVSLLISGCISFSTMHPAEPLRPGRAAFFLAGGYTEMGLDFTERDVHTNEEKTVKSLLSVPVIEYGLRYGLVRDVEVGLKSSLFGSTFADVKYRLLQINAFTLSTGFGLGYSDVVLSSGAEDKDTDADTDFARSVYELHLPLYTSYAVTKTFYLYAAPRYVYRSIAGKNASSMAGISVGTIFGSSTGILLEYSTFKGLGEKDVVDQFMIGLVFGFDNYHQDRFKDDQG